MKALAALAVIAAVLLLLGQVRLGVRAEYGALGFSVWARLGPLNIKVFPRGKKREKKPPKKKKQPEKPAEEKPKESVLERAGGAADYAMALLPVVLDAAAGFGERLQVDFLRLELTAGAEDPADAALRYGQAVAALGCFWTPLTRAFRVRDGEARALVDFGCGGMTLYGAAALSLKLGQIVRLGLRTGWRGLRAFLGVRRKRRREKKERLSVNA